MSHNYKEIHTAPAKQLTAPRWAERTVEQLVQKGVGLHPNQWYQSRC
jgi:hypothetical protein